MTTLNPPTNSPQPQQRRQQHDPLLIVLLATVAGLVVAATMYLAYTHPRLAVPLSVGGTFLSSLVTMCALMLRRR
ncbi:MULTISPECIES: hypothetical protein [unclassified Streptomyces]|uniref:hypothetical protein n=1 Tax=unclassified Streptomyces TaxID=2593676 RepID=UPI000747F42B|nr:MULTISPECIES: hypothetical protein [unclassified Streptomyces]KUL73913.1 hypothetical protein ADL34_18780 [Streptomyces sp. NRRL WC-3605]KUL74370.1 hypothetical protein ADL33_17910 [Streptomyces sp. NRRL WC-3604]